MFHVKPRDFLGVVERLFAAAVAALTIFFTVRSIVIGLRIRRLKRQIVDRLVVACFAAGYSLRWAVKLMSIVTSSPTASGQAVMPNSERLMVVLA